MEGMGTHLRIESRGLNMALAAGIMAGGAIIGGLLQSNAAQDAAQTQANAATQVAGMSQA